MTAIAAAPLLCAGPQALACGAVLAVVSLAVVAGAAISSGAIKSADSAADQDLAKADATPCESCAKKNCATAAAGSPGSKYKGGAHGLMKEPPKDGLESHHMPADSVSPLPREMGPAIQMDPADHAQTNSYKGRVRGPGYATQRALLAAGSSMAAMELDIANVRTIAAAQGNPTKYDDAISQMRAYANCLKKYGMMR